MVLECLLLMGDILARPSFVTQGALRNWLGGGKGMSPSAATEPQCCLMACLFPAVPAEFCCDVMLHCHTQAPGVPMGLVGAAVSGSCGAVSHHARSMKERFFISIFLIAKLLSLMKEESKGGRGQLQRECTGKAVLSFGVKNRFLCISGYKPW